MTFSRSFWASKTTWVAISMIATAIAAALGNHLNPWHAALVSLASILAAAVRDAQVKGLDAVAAGLEAVAAGPKADGGEVKP